MNNSTLASPPVPRPEAYLITFACYGARRHGDSRGTIDRHHNAYGGRYAAEDPIRNGVERSLQRDPSFDLDAPSRTLVLQVIQEVCNHESWLLHAAHVRLAHAHTVLTVPHPPEHALGKLKAYSSRALNRAEGRIRKRWARHGSTVYLWDAGQIHDAVEYTVLRQGVPTAVYVNINLWPQFA